MSDIGARLALRCGFAMNLQDLGLLSSFVEAADCGSFTEAARRLTLTPATVSRNIARIEADLGLRLFNRTTRLLHLTDEGRLYLESVKSALSLLEDSEIQLIDAGLQPSGVLKVAMPVFFSVTYVLPRLRHFLDINDRMSLDITFDGNPADPVRDGYDLVIRHGAPTDGSHIVRKLCEERQILVASPAYLAEYGVPARPEDLADHLCITYKAESNQTHAWILRPIGDPAEDEARSLLHNPRTRLRFFGEACGGIDAALAGLGISVVSYIHARKPLAEGKLKVVLPDFKFVDGTGLAKIHAVYPDRRFLLPKVRKFIDFLVEAIQQEEAELARLDALATQ